MNSRKMLIYFVVGAILGFCNEFASAQSILRVDIASDATSPDGSDWDGSTTGKCYKYLQDAIDAAQPDDIIWIAQGEYYPDEDSANPTGTGLAGATFELKARVVMRGAFKGTIGYDANPVNSTADENDPDLYETILSGDLNEDDNPLLPLTQSNRSENTNTVVTVESGALEDNTSLDNLTVCDGDGAFGGAGILLEFGASPTINNCKIIRNRATGPGGGLFAQGDSSPVITSCHFDDNEAGEGGGLKVQRGNLFLPVLAQVFDCTFTNNRGLIQGGGGLTVKFGAEVEVEDSTFEDNFGGQGIFSGTIGGGGALSCLDGTLRLRRCTFESNRVEGAWAAVRQRMRKAASKLLIACFAITPPPQFPRRCLAPALAAACISTVTRP